MSTVAEPFGGYDFGANVVRKDEISFVRKPENHRHEGDPAGVQLTIEHAVIMLEADRVLRLERRQSAAEAIARHHMAARELYNVETSTEHPADREPFEIDL